jgi:hypothetical protein
LGITATHKEEKEYYLTTPTSLLQSSLISLWNDHLKKEKIRAVLLQMDDMHYLVNSAKGAIYDIRAVFQELPEYDCNYQLIITGLIDLFAHIRDLAEPLVRFFDSIYLKPFDLESTKNDISLPLERENIPITFDEEVIYEIHQKTEGHPYFIAFIMHDLIDAIQKGSITKEYFQELWIEIFKHIVKEKFERDFSLASEKERQLLLDIAKSSSLIITPRDLPTDYQFVIFDRLCQKNLLTRVERGRYKLYHPLFREYLRGL